MNKFIAAALTLSVLALGSPAYAGKLPNGDAVNTNLPTKVLGTSSQIQLHFGGPPRSYCHPVDGPPPPHKGPRDRVYDLPACVAP